MTCNNVVLPQPVGPMMPKNSRSRTSRLTPPIARMSPWLVVYTLVNPRTTTFMLIIFWHRNRWRHTQVEHRQHDRRQVQNHANRSRWHLRDLAQYVQQGRPAAAEGRPRLLRPTAA